MEYQKFNVQTNQKFQAAPRRLGSSLKKKDDNYFFTCDSDALIVKGLLSLLCKIFSGQKSEEILSISHSDILNSIGLSGLITVQRTNGFASAVKKIHEMSM